MSIKCVPTYATLVLGILEEKLCDVIEENSDIEFRDYFEQMCRYLDDFFIILKEYLQELNK